MSRWSAQLGFLGGMLESENALYVPGRPVREMKIFTKVLGVGSLVIGGLVIAGLVSPEFAESSGWNNHLLVRVGLSALALVGIWGFIHSLNLKVSFEKDGLTHRGFFRISREIPYSSIKQYGLEPFLGGTGLTIYTEKKKYRIACTLVGFEYLHEQIRKNVGRDKQKDKTIIY